MGEKTTKYPFVSEGEMMFGKKVRVKSKDLLGFRNFFTKKAISTTHLWRQTYLIPTLG